MFFRGLTLTFCLALASIPAAAAVATIGSRATFNAQGTIAFNSNFSDFGGPFSNPGDPFTRGDVTYTSTQNLIIGAGSGYGIGDLTPVMGNNWWTPVTGDIGGTYDLFGFDAALNTGLLSITLTTNQNTYQYTNLLPANGQTALTFYGFRALGVGEYFTSFRLDSDGVGYLGGLTNVAVGNAGEVGAVPEPSSILLLASGAGVFAFARRRFVR